MPFRTTNTTKGRCAVCATPATRRCQNCKVSHCDPHMVEASCAGCTATLWGLARRRTNLITLASVVGGAGALVAATAFVPFSVMPIVLLGIGATVGAAVPRAASVLVARGLANRKLPKSSVRLQLPAASEVSVPRLEKKESAYEIRRRRNKSKSGRGSGGGVRAVFMTRGGYFYQ